MKTKIFSFLITLFVLVLNTSAQTGTYIYTPRNSSFIAWTSIPEMSDDDKSDWSDYVVYYYPSATEINAPSATNSYNCHGFAWHVSEGGSNVWIGLAGYDANPNIVEDIYWNDQSYIETTEPYASKISYNADNHSAIQTSTQGIYRSKWGNGPLMQHARNYGPAEYQMSTRKYYRLNLGITGSTSLLCSGQRTVSSNSAISGSTYSWSNSAGLNYVSGAGTTSYTVSTGSSGDQWIGLQMTTPSGEVATANNLGFWVGTAQVQSISGPSSGSRYVTYTFYANVNHSAGTSYTWWSSPAGPYLTPGGGELNSCGAYFYSNGYYTILARATNACGTTTPSSKGINIGSKMLSGKSLNLYPNPALNNVTATIKTDPLLVGNETDLVSTEKDSKGGEPITYTIRIYNNKSNLLSTMSRSGNTFSIPLSNMRDGTYIIEVSDGKDRYTQQLIIKH
jgi:hypothetical protein